MGSTKILLTTDDGIHSPGLRAAAETLLELGEVTIVAPLNQQTSMGRSYHAHPDAVLVPVPFEIDGTNVQTYSCECSPAVAIRHGMDVLFQDKNPDLVVAGINYGENLSIGIGTSGTVGAALEGAVRGVPALGISKQTDVYSHRNYTEQDWSVSQFFLKLFAERLLSAKMPFDVDALKVDIPDNATEQTPWRITRLARRTYYSRILSNPSVKTRVRDMKTGIEPSATQAEPGTDVHAIVVERVVSVTPVSLDATSRVRSEELDRVLKS
ncbi:MAG: 5'/3'-nucleotidase SurE [Sedimentisphaerales bacterium]|nr:5'/3'-nucleotidase SurE [Sedimentisphaerales bacterium]